MSILGAGGMGTVELAEDTVLGRSVALKRLTGTGDARDLSRLRREALLGASVSHPNVVSIYDVVSSEDGDLVIVMEYVSGETLRDRLGREGRISAAEALRILDGVAAGLDAIHERRVVHRDVKPPNILLGTNGAVKVADLGIALVPDRTRITSAGAVMGSFSYMAPEQLEDGPSTPSVDVYALSAVAFEMLSGRKARPEPNPVALAHALATQPPPDLREAWPEAPPEAAELLVRGMSRDPGARPRSAGELVGRLRAALLPLRTAPVAPPPPPRRPPAVVRTPPPRRRPPAVVATPNAGGPLPAAGAPQAPSRHRSTRRWTPVAGLLALAALAVALVALLSTGGSNPKVAARTTASRHGHTASRARPAVPVSGTSTSSSSPSPPAASAPRSSTAAPVDAVESFYGLAAAHRYSEAWTLADSTFRNQLGGYQSFEAGQAGDRAISFDAANVVSQSAGSASVAVRTTSVRTDGTRHCAGTADLLRSGSSGTWLVHMIHINCS